MLFSSKLSASLPDIFSFVIEAVLIYFLMVTAYLLGRFYRQPQTEYLRYWN
jgi:hypothetical protein